MRWLAIAVCLFSAWKALAVEPGELLDDPVLESRAREISSNLRCLICRNESIDDSSAELASDLRNIVREQLLAGKSDDDVYAFVVDRYGEFVLLKPNLNGANVILYASGPIMLVIGGVIWAFYFRRRRAPFLRAEALRKEEQERLAKILSE